MVAHEAIRLMVVDDQALIRRGLELVFDLEPDIDVVASLPSAEAALDAVPALSIDVALVDVLMPGMGGVAAARDLSRYCRVVMLTSSDDPTTVRDALTGGAVGYVTKDVSPERLVEVVRMAAAGLSVLGESQLAHALSAAAAGEPPASTGLTHREREILRLLAEGGTNADLARHLSISEATVRTHLTRIFQKLGARNRTEAVARARASSAI